MKLTITSPTLKFGPNLPFLAQYRLKREFFEKSRRNKAGKSSTYDEMVFLTYFDIPMTKMKSTITSPTLNLGPNLPFFCPI